MPRTTFPAAATGLPTVSRKAERQPTRYAVKNGVSPSDLHFVENAADRLTRLIDRLFTAAHAEDTLVCLALARDLSIEVGIFSMDAYLGRVLDALTEGGYAAQRERWRKWGVEAERREQREAKLLLKDAAREKRTAKAKKRKGGAA
jgi:hypothetical protein